MNGLIDMGQMYYDSVDVNITSTLNSNSSPEAGSPYVDGN